ncbi:unnamed protein product [Trypanosoma congolense IL3000]|uniref:WGS project CAEQ00000000 data, annotated contig 2143 n=1 Tax=Trypanosoma congolense (strain IL3000) TaxID=1068625 RepID=F9WBS8_TRYCI|nr:unnamed protein product [Trypanosoma congolense IL3000]
MQDHLFAQGLTQLGDTLENLLEGVGGHMALLRTLQKVCQGQHAQRRLNMRARWLEKVVQVQTAWVPTEIHEHHPDITLHGPKKETLPRDGELRCWWRGGAGSPQDAVYGVAGRCLPLTRASVGLARAIAAFSVWDGLLLWLGLVLALGAWAIAV